MAASWKSSIKALILDMDGVLWRGSEPIGNLASIFSRIRQLGWSVAFATNNATRSANQYVELLRSFGVPTEPWQIVTSATAVTAYLHNILPDGGPVYIVGEYGLLEACEMEGYSHSPEGAQAVIAGMDRDLTYTKLKTATILLRKGAPFIGTNPDPTFPTPEGLIPGAGSILAALSTASARIPVIVGKPEPLMYEVAMERLSVSPGQTLVVGDRPETDIIGAQRIGCRTALVLSGVTNDEQAARFQPAPDIITACLDSLVSMEW